MCQNGNFSLEIEQNQQNQKKKKKDFHGINVKFLLSFFCFYYPMLASGIGVILLKRFKSFFNLKT
ncbi:hypothetical protein VN0338_02920 [Helicobacter pylori]|nr:hypothetical protein VN0338_02920 [Helicobacter pylori]